MTDSTGQNPRQNSPAEGDNSGKSDSRSQRRYFRKRNPAKGKQADKGMQGTKSQNPAVPTSQDNVAPAERTPRGSTPHDYAGSGRNRPARRRRRNRRREEPVVAPSAPALPEESSDYVEPIAVYIYTHTIRPAYRDYRDTHGLRPERFAPYREAEPDPELQGDAGVDAPADDEFSTP